jgi:hypothetical protein
MSSQKKNTVPEIITPSPGHLLPESCPAQQRRSPVFLIGTATVDLLRVEFVFPAGQVMEEAHLEASAANAMLTEGTLCHDANEINDLIDSTGAALTHTADKDTAGLVTVTLTGNLKR